LQHPSPVKQMTLNVNCKVKEISNDKKVAKNQADSCENNFQ